MRIIMRIFFLMCILGASLTIAAQNIIYGNKNEQRAINMALIFCKFITIQKNCVFQIRFMILIGIFFQIWLILRPNKFSGLIE